MWYRWTFETIANSVYLSITSDPGTIIAVPCVSLNYSTSCLLILLKPVSILENIVGFGEYFMYCLISWSVWSETLGCHVHFLFDRIARSGSVSPRVGRTPRRLNLGEIMWKLVWSKLLRFSFNYFFGFKLSKVAPFKIAKLKSPKFKWGFIQLKVSSDKWGKRVKAGCNQMRKPFSGLCS